MSPAEEPAGEAGPESARGADLVGRHGRLVRRTALVSGLTLGSRILGYVREMLSAALFGDRSGIYDAFITAWRVPNLFRRLLGEGAISTSFQTALTEVDGNHGEEAGRRLFLDTARMLVGILVAVAVVVMALVGLAPDVMPGTGWHWLGRDPGAVRELTLRLAPFVIFICASAFVGGALQVRGHFSAPAWAPASLNLVWISVLIGIGLHFGWSVSPDDQGVHMEMSRWLSWGVLVAGVVQLAVQVPALIRMGLLRRGPRPARAADGPGAGTVLRRAVPLALGAAIYQINVMVDGLMAESLLPDGGPTLHYFANRVQQFPLALVAIAATSAVFPLLQAHGHKGDRGALRTLHDTTHRGIAFVALPASLGLFALADPVIAVSFQHGAFGAEGVERAGAALRWLALALIPAGATGLVARTYYSLGDFVTPVRISVVMLLANIGLNLVAILALGLDVDGLSMATALTSWGTLLVMLPGLRTKLGLPAPIAGLPAAFARMMAAALISGAAAWLAWRGVSGGEASSLAGLMAGIVAGIGVYAPLAWSLGLEEARRTWARVRRSG